MLCAHLRRRRSNNHDVDKLVWASRKNIVVTGVPDRGRRYLSDFYTTLIDIRWRWNLLFFVVGFVLTWVVFAMYYYLLCFLHGDLDPQHKPENVTWIPCVENVNSFTEAYLFSIETMSTIGYGWRYQTEECPGVYLAVMLQSVIGAGLQFALASLVVSKTRRANRFSQTILFSNTAVMYKEDGQLKLAVRIGDMRKGDVIGAHATGMLIRKTTGKEGHRVPVRMFTVPFEAEGGRQKLFLCWPCLLIHIVDQHSPFWSLSREDLLNGMYELIVILDGVAATTSKPFQARKSYHSWEILWGRRFKPLTIKDDDRNSSGYIVNYKTFNDTFAVAIPFCSAQALERKRLFKQFNSEYEDEDLENEVDDCVGRFSDLRIEEDEQSTDSFRSPSSDFEDKDEALTCEDAVPQTDQEENRALGGAYGAEAPNRKDSETSYGGCSIASEGNISEISYGRSSVASERRISEISYGTSSNTYRRKISEISSGGSSVASAAAKRKISDTSYGRSVASTAARRKISETSYGRSSTKPKRKISEPIYRGASSGCKRKISEPAYTSSPKQNDKICVPYIQPKDRQRKISRVEFQPFPAALKGTQPQRRLSLGDALNMYRHRRSVTDTYLGTELPEEDSDDSEASAAILSIVSQQSRGQQDGKPDVRDVFKLRRKSTTLQLMFGTEGLDNDVDTR